MDSDNNKKEIYDLIHSSSLDDLYKKNSQLLARLSGVTHENKALENELQSAIKEKSKKDVKNVFLNSRVQSLREQVSVFARQQKQFNQQSRLFRKELQKLKIVQSPEQELEQKSKKEHQTLKVSHAQNQLMAQKLIRYIHYRQKIKGAHRNLKDKIQSLEIRLEEVSQNLLKAKEASQTLLNAKDNSMSSKDFNKQIKSLHQLVQTLKNQQEEILKENDNLIDENRKYKNNTDILVDQNKKYKDSTETLDLKKQVQELKQNLEAQQEEKTSLTKQHHQTRVLLSQQQDGFEQAMMSFQRRYQKTEGQLQETQQSLEDRIINLSGLKTELHETQDQLEQQSQDFQKELSQKLEELKQDSLSQKQSELKSMQLDLDQEKTKNQELENQTYQIKQESVDRLFKQRNEFTNQITDLKSALESQNLNHQTENKELTEDLKQEHETRVSQLDQSYERKLKHIRVEMENDFLSERRRTDVFKSMKETQISELKTELDEFQKQNHEYKTSQLALEQAHQEGLAQLKQNISKNKQLEEENKNISHLWHQVQLDLEKKNQQVQALQKLNKDISLTMNQNKLTEAKPPKIPSLFNKDGLQFVQKVSAGKTIKIQSNLEDKKEANNAPNILADIHFD